MEEQVKLPDMGEGVESATVVGILVEVGQQVQVDQGIIELETDKAVAEVPSPKAGKVQKVHVEPDDEVKPGTLLMTLESGEEAEGNEGGQAEPKEEAKEEKPAREEPSKKEGQAEEEPSGEGEKARKGEEAGKGQKGEKSDEPEPSERKPAREETAEQPRAGAETGKVPAAPYTRRLARELDVDLGTVSGSGEGGWITEQDVKAAARGAARRAPSAEPAGGDRDDWGPVRRERLSKIRRTIAEKMAESHATVARVTNFADADVTELEDFRSRHKDEYADEGVKLTPLAFVVRAVVAALKDHPALAASLDMDAGEIIYKQYVSIGIAVDSDRGLIVPVLREADRLSVVETARRIEELAGKIRSGDFEVADLRGGVFTVTNLGSIGGRYATPVVNHPESAILLTGRSRPQPVVRDGGIAIRTILPLSLSYDHRIIDGAEAARFLNDVIESLEDPGDLLLR
jgi:pyruvate dehydrogenase E2 component (dihydrolipoamide acetyltransferase)